MIVFQGYYFVIFSHSCDPVYPLFGSKLIAMLPMNVCIYGIGRVITLMGWVRTSSVGETTEGRMSSVSLAASILQFLLFIVIVEELI